MATPLKQIYLDQLKAWLMPIQRDSAASVYNGCVIVLRKLFEIGIRNGCCRVNPALELAHVQPPRRNSKLPDDLEWTEIVASIRYGGDRDDVCKTMTLLKILGGYRNGKGETDWMKAFKEHPEWKTLLGVDDKDAQSWQRLYVRASWLKTHGKDPCRERMESADMVEFLTYTGARINETRHLRYTDVSLDEKADEKVKAGECAGTITFQRLTVKGMADDKVIPIHPDLVPTLRRCIARKNPGGKLFKSASCRKALQSACRRLGLPSMSHHDLRHLFATTALESNLPPLVVAELLGQRDKGRSLHTNYAEHRARVAAKHVGRIQFDAPKPGSDTVTINGKTISQEQLETLLNVLASLKG